MIDFFLVILLLVLAPKALFQGKGRSLLKKFSFKHLPHPQQELIWIHGVSVGEIKAAKSLFLELKRKYPNSFFLSQQPLLQDKPKPFAL